MIRNYLEQGVEDFRSSVLLISQRLLFSFFLFFKNSSRTLRQPCLSGRTAEFRRFEVLINSGAEEQPSQVKLAPGPCVSGDSPAGRQSGDPIA